MIIKKIGCTILGVIGKACQHQAQDQCNQHQNSSDHIIRTPSKRKPGKLFYINFDNQPLIQNKSISLQFASKAGVKLHEEKWSIRKWGRPAGCLTSPHPIIAPIVPQLGLISAQICRKFPPIFGSHWSNAVKWPQNNWSRVVFPFIRICNRPCVA